MAYMAAGYGVPFACCRAMPAALIFTDMKRLLIIAALAMLCASTASARRVYNIDSGWRFTTADGRVSRTVDLPHTWNMDALAGMAYYRGQGNYMKHVDVPSEWQGQRVFIRFYGAGTVADLLVNGHHTGTHAGGNNAFEFEITNLLEYGKRNLLWVAVNNAPRLDVLPATGEECVYGGLYRGAEIVVTGQSAIGFDGYGGCGVRFSVDEATSGRAAGRAVVAVNASDTHAVQLSMTIRDACDSVVYACHARHRAEKGVSEAELPFEIGHPELWHGTRNPYLYHVTVTLEDGAVADTVSFRTGMRTLEVDATGGFILNGEHYPLRGVVMWRDQAVYGPVFDEEQLRRDVGIIREMGANAVRVAGGTHCPAFYDICDEEGMVVLADGPYVDMKSFDGRGYYGTEAFRQNGMAQMRELVMQRYNNPSVAFWGIFVEPELNGDDPLPFIRELNGMVKRLDRSRPTVGMSNKDGDVNLITDLVVWNHTLGWLYGQPEDMALCHAQLRGDSLWNGLRSAVSYRAAGVARRYSESLSLRRGSAGKGPCTETWQAGMHRMHMRTLSADSAFWAIFVGDMFDHAAVRNGAGVPAGAGDCGLVTADRAVRKDAFWFYKANWNDSDPFLHIASGNHRVCTSRVQTITVYTNLDAAELKVNGVSLGVRIPQGGIAEWEGVALADGDNAVEVFTVLPGNDDYVTISDRAVFMCSDDGNL